MSAFGKPAAEPPMWEQETQLAKQFVQQFYNFFDTNRAQLATLYRDASQISFEGATVQGGTVFLQRLNQLNLPTGAVHRVVTVDAQPSVAGGGALIVFVTGEYVGQQYSEVFQLVDSGGMYVHNNIFRVSNSNAFNVPDGAKDVAKSFIEFYYTTYDTNRAALINLYRPTSCYTHEEMRFKGVDAILAKLQEMPAVNHDPASITADVQQVQAGSNAIILIFITGRLMLAEESNPLNFTETFQLVQDGQSFYIGNHVFRLKYG